MYCLIYLLLNSASFKTHNLLAWFVKERPFTMVPGVSFLWLYKNFGWEELHMTSEVIVKCLRLRAVSSLNISVLICCYPLVSNSSLGLNQVTNWRTSTFVCKRGVIKSRTGVFRWGFPWASAPLKFCTVFACHTTQTIFKVAVAWKQKHSSVKVLVVRSFLLTAKCFNIQLTV